MTSPAPNPISNAELKAHALRAANGRSFSRRGISASWLWEWAKVVPVAIALFVVLRTFIVEAYKIPTGSMERTLLVGDFLLVNKMVFGANVPFSSARTPAIRVPQVGDVVVFTYPVDPTMTFVKRLVGRPGDTLAMHNGILTRNSVAQSEPYVVHAEPGIDPVTNEFQWQDSYLVGTAVAADTAVTALPSDSAGIVAVPRVTAESSAYRASRNNWGPLVVPPGHLFVLGDNRDHSLDSRYWGFVADSLVRGTPLVVYYSFAPDSASPAPWLTRIRWSRFGSRVR